MEGVGTVGREILSQQRAWAERKRLPLRDPRHTLRTDDNLFRRRLSEAARWEFTQGAGHELGDPRRPETPPGLSALLSSAALVYNVFDYWRDGDKTPLLEACGADARTATLTLERTFPLWRGGTPPHLDVVLGGPGCVPTAIEGKFTETYRVATNGFRSTYFERDAIWEGLRQCRRLAERVRDGRERYKHLGVAQLLKHVLGLSKEHGVGQFRLLYLWFEWPGLEAEQHWRELERFSRSLGNEVAFAVQTYQDLFKRLQRARAQHTEYVDYLTDRYLSLPG